MELACIHEAFFPTSDSIYWIATLRGVARVIEIEFYEHGVCDIFDLGQPMQTPLLALCLILHQLLSKVAEHF